jgi:hypothetical protein
MSATRKPEVGDQIRLTCECHKGRTAEIVQVRKNEKAITFRIDGEEFSAGIQRGPWEPIKQEADNV